MKILDRLVAHAVLIFIGVIALSVWAAFYAGPLVTPKCHDGEAPIQLQKWYCVQVREP